MKETPPICDYEGSDYRTRFWEGQGRTYEDQVERIALHQLMPAVGSTLIEIGAGFGRLADEYKGYKKVVLFDYSRSLLREAQAHLGPDPRFIYVAGNWYTMPFVSNLFETMIQIRTLHHAADAPALFKELARIVRPHGTYVLEFANKRNLKAIARYWLNQQEWSPFDQGPVEFVKLNFDFHPDWIQKQLKSSGFQPGKMRTVSHFRFAPLKKIAPTKWLTWADQQLQPTAKLFQLTPSVFIKSTPQKNGNPAAANTFFACPQCNTGLPAVPTNGRLHCRTCTVDWQVKDNLYDFKSPIEKSAG